MVTRVGADHVARGLWNQMEFPPALVTLDALLNFVTCARPPSWML